MVLQDVLNGIPQPNLVCFAQKQLDPCLEQLEYQHRAFVHQSKVWLRVVLEVLLASSKPLYPVVALQQVIRRLIDRHKQR